MRMDLTEDQLVAAVAKVLSGEAPGVLLGVGDDAALVEPGRGSMVLTTDMLLEGVHFDLGAIAPTDLGAKSIVVNVSDVAAMGGSPRYAVVSLGVPPTVETAWLIELYGGMRAACDEYALSLVGGDTNRADRVTIAVTVIGEVAPNSAVRRDGARPGDLVGVTGSLGAAAGGFLLSRLPPPKLGRALGEPWGRALLEALHRPIARVGEGQTLAQEGATAMMDLSDGLAKDLSRLCAASGCGARIRTDAVPVADALLAAADTLGVDALELALSGGEDYELVATLDATAFDRARDELDERFGVTLTEVGVIIDEGLVAAGPDGERPLEPRGWDHFAHDG
jgi:thiamine-monophosphate kinase